MIFHEVADYTDVFYKKNAEKLLKYKEDNYAIKLNEQDSSFEFLYNLLSLKLKTLWEYLDNALAKKWIRHFISPAGVLILFIFKRDSSFYFCVDYQTLNKIMIKNHHILPLINEILNQLIEARWFIKFDLKNAYYQLCIRHNNEWKTAFHTQYNHFEYIIILFNLFNVSAIF